MGQNQSRPRDGARVLVVDHRDSFTWNIVDALARRGARCDVRQSDDLTVEEVVSGPWRGVVVGPGPCAPKDAAVSVDVARVARQPLLGVCLGHQIVAEAFGGRTVRARRPVHGKAEPITHDGLGLFRGLRPSFRVARYHSLAVDEASLPADLGVTARSSDGEIMGLRHRSRPIETVQFHPESWLGELGDALFHNWLLEVGSCS